MGDQPEAWPVVESQDIWRGAAPFAVRRDTLTSPEGSAPFSRVVVEHPGASIVLALDEDDRVLVVEQYRHVTGRRLVELPAGLLDVPGEDPLVCAQRELLEEAGYAAREWSHLLSVFSSPGLIGEIQHIYVARDLTEVPDRGGFELEHEEAAMTVSWVPFDDLLQACWEGRVQDSPLVLAVMAYALRHR
ncbi:MAG: NUDIX hydrolase [Nocardioidaceae bacterium]